jgi:hypothetical protein
MSIRSFRPGAALFLLAVLIGGAWYWWMPRAAAEYTNTPFQLGWSTTQADVTNAAVWGDVDGDGRLDLIVGNSGSIRLYRNMGGTLDTTPSLSLTLNETVTSLDLGDIDGDGDLDLATGSDGSAVKVYLNTAGTFTPFWSAGVVDHTNSVAWGDIDNDGDLDLAVGNANQPLRVYMNTSGSLETAASWISSASDWVYAITWGDVDNDGDLDLAVGTAQQNRLYINANGSLETVASWSSSPATARFTQSVTWGDVDNDGDLDLMAGNGSTAGASNHLFENRDGVLTVEPIWISEEEDATRSVAWGDVDNDGDLDLAVGNIGLSGEPNRLYENVDGELNVTAAWSSVETDASSTVAWGDVDNDGDLDLAVGNGGINTQLSRLYINRLGVVLPAASTSFTTTDDIQSAALGDVDGDGDLDLAIGTERQPTRVYPNNDGTFSTTPLWSSTEISKTTSVAWGDVDGDGDLDLAVGNSYQAVQIYHNNGTTFNSEPAWSSTERDRVTSLAWGDVDGDGDLDLAAGTRGGDPIRLYLNKNGQLDPTAAWFAAGSSMATSIAWGDVDNDGDLDLVVGNDREPTLLYHNNGGTLTAQPVWETTETDSSTSLAWGDVDGDGDLDLAVGNSYEPNRLYLNNGGILTSEAVWVSIEADNTTSLAWGDVDGDGDLDLAAGNHFDQANRIYLNEGGTLTNSAAWTASESGSTVDLAWGDVDNDGDLDLVTTTMAGEANRVYLNWRNRSNNPQAIPSVSVTRSGATAEGSGYSVATVLDGPSIPIAYTLSHPDGRPVREVRVEYSLNGGGDWQPAMPAAGTQTTDLSSSPAGTAHTFVWDVYGSGVMGRHDNVVLRITALPDLRTVSGTTPGPFVYGASTTTSSSFRVRGSQVRVLQDGQPVAGALVYRRPAGQTSALGAYAGLDGQPFQTDEQGYLQGSGQVEIGDQLIATLPISATEVYTLYFTSAAPTVAGMQSTEVDAAGLQTLSVSADNPLILFNLDISLEWDARNDERFLSQLRFNLQRASELLFDWTDGQAALGDLTIYHNAEHWDDAHVRIYATNRLRPNANQGGIVAYEITDPMVPSGGAGDSLTYAPGQVRMGATWNRYGEAYGDLGEDWPRTFTHELGHFLFFLDDNYLGLDSFGRLIPVTSCRGAMANPYRDDYGEFHPSTGWLPACEATLSNRSTGRDDWSTIRAFYSFPELSFTIREPAVFAINPGPRTLPLGVTRIREIDPETPTTTIVAPIFTLTQDGQRILPGSGARAILYRPDDDRLIDLGSPVLDQVTARGARVDDRLCVYDLAKGRLGCVENLEALTSELPLVNRTDWTPDVVVTPVTSRTLAIDVRQVDAGLHLRAKVYPFSGAATDPVSFASVAEGYRAEVTLDEPSLGGYVQVWVADDPDPAIRREVVVDYALGGNPGVKFGSNAPRGNNPGPKFGSNAPAVSSDGQAVIYGNNLNFSEGQFFTLQSASLIPDPPPGRTSVGQAYWLSATEDAPDLGAASLSISYLSREVQAAEEIGIEMYFWDGNDWTALDTTLSTERNEAAALIPGPGLYTLMSSYRIPLSQTGWNLIAYPVPGTRPVADALVSIADLYTVVYGYDPSDSDHWKVFDADAPAWANDLEALEYGRGYWLHVTEEATLYIKGAATSETSTDSDLQMLIPPATLYGIFELGSDFQPVIGETVIARIGDIVCGQSQTRRVDDQIVFSIEVAAEGLGGVDGCGAPGRQVDITIGSLVLSTAWDNSRVMDAQRPAELRMQQLFLPLVMR